MEVESTEVVKTKDYHLSDLEEDADIDVMTEVQTKQETVAVPVEADTSTKESPLTETEAEDSTENAHGRSGSWSGYLKKKLSSKKGDGTQKDSQTEHKKRDWSKEQEALTKLKTSAVSTLNTMGTKFNEGGVYLYEASRRTAHATAENMKKIRLFKTPIEVLCRNEAAQRPCPRVLLICCAAIAASGLSVEDIFKYDAPEELIHAVSAHFLGDNGAVLPPSGATPEVLAGVIKKFLMDLDEPLFTFKLHDAWMQAGRHPQTAKQVMEQLPPANLYSLDVLLDCLNRIASNSAVNRMTADALAEAMAPCLLWKVIKPPSSLSSRLSGKGALPVPKMFAKNPPSPGKEEDDKGSTDFSSVIESPAHSLQDTSDKQGRTVLHGEELQNTVKCLSHLIVNYRPS